jgi:hypothetical protein
VGRDEGGVVPGTADEGAGAPGLEALPDEVQAGQLGDAVAVPQLAPTVEHRHVQPAVVAAVTGGPQHGADAGGGQVDPLRRCGQHHRRWAVRRAHLAVQPGR